MRVERIDLNGRDVVDLSKEYAPYEVVTLEIAQLDRKTPLKIVGNLVLNEGAEVNLIEADLGRFDLQMDLHVRLNGFRSSFTARIAALTEGSETKIYKADTVHIGKESKSLVSMFGVCNGTSRLEFRGTSDIKNGAEKTHTRQEGKIVDLSGQAKCEVSPSLLIDEEDVYASHAASMGSVSQDDIFYLMSRGLDRKTAERLVTIGLLKPIVFQLSDEGEKEKALALLESEI